MESLALRALDYAGSAQDEPVGEWSWVGVDMYIRVDGVLWVFSIFSSLQLDVLKPLLP
jgi:hypothetical protein